jgi:hypothetical protein
MVLGITGLFMNSTQVAAQNPHPGSAPVNIVSPLPLPVTGSLNVSGGSVEVSGTVNVRDVDNPAGQPFQFSNQLPTGNFRVPDGKRFVIEYFSARAQTTADNNCSLAVLTISTQTNTVSFPGVPLAKNHYFTPTPTTTNLSTNVFVVSQPTRLYADPGTIVGGDVDFRGSACAGAINFADITFSGYLVDLP